MKSKTVFKVILLVMVVMLLAMPITTFAADDLWEELGGNTNTGTGEGNEQPPVEQPPVEETPVEQQPPVEETPVVEQPPVEDEIEYNDAGLAEDTMLIVSVVALGGIAIYAYRKVNEYKYI